MRRAAFVLSVLLLLTLSAWAGDPLSQTDLAFCQATQERGLEGWLSYFADDATIAQKYPPVYGKDALREHYKKLFALKDLDFKWWPVKAEIFPGGELGYTVGRFTRSFTTPDGNKVSQKGSYLSIWKKQKDGSWKILSDFGAADE
jgi:ketosteroid isomerase-like protein